MSPHKAYLYVFFCFTLAACDAQHNVGSIENGSKQACGGIAGKPCPQGEVCIDDPADSCDPRTGGADCAGSCRKPTGPQCSPDLPPNLICPLIYCGGGYKVVSGQTTCECCDACPDVICALHCPNGFKKDAKGCNICQCEPPPGQCSGPNPQGCAKTGCPNGQKCDTSSGCAPSACGCDPATGWVCTADCGGGVCVPSTCPPVVCTLACPNGFKKGADGCPICACEERTPATGQCVRNSNDACKSDGDCKAGGCGGEVCYNPALGGGVSTCDCFQPTGVSCGCVEGRCTWWK
jgi:hypothetical protein